MKSTILAALAVGGFLVCTGAVAQPAPYYERGQTLVVRMDRFRASIAQNERNGILTPGLAHSALLELDDIKRTDDNWRAANGAIGGHLTVDQWHTLNQRLISLEQRAHYSEAVNSERR